MVEPGEVSRRSALRAAPVVAAGGLVLAGAGQAVASAEETIKLVASRTKNSLPAEPEFGTSFAMLLALFDTNAAAVGEGSVHGTIVNVTADTPPKLIVQATIVLRLTFKGELHLGTMHPMVLPSPLENPLAVLGGQGAYATARGDGSITYPSTDRINFTIKVKTD